MADEIGMDTGAGSAEATRQAPASGRSLGGFDAAATSTTAAAAAEEGRGTPDEIRARARAAQSLASQEVVDATRKAVEVAILGGPRRYDRDEVAELSGMSPEQCTELWKAMGFAVPPDPGAVNYTDSDVDALRTLQRLTDSGVLSPEIQSPIVRATGQAMSRLAEWQVSLVTEFVLHALMGNHALGDADEPFDEQTVTEAVTTTADALMPLISTIQNHVWRRHTAAAAERIIILTRDGDESQTLAIGFADMVGYTSLTRRIDIAELSDLLDRFEAISARVIAEHRGRVIKKVGDEVMFSADDPATAAAIGIALQQEIDEDDGLPKIRVGLAYGDVLVRFGDAYGAVVNIAARLTGSAKPGTILVDEQFAEALDPPEGATMRSIRPIRVHGYRRLKAKQLKWRRSRSAERRDDAHEAPSEVGEG